MSASELAVVSARGRVVRPLLNLYAALCYVFLFGPIVLLVVFSFNRNRYGSFPITGWTTTWYSQVFSDPQIAAALRTSLQVAVEVTIISVVVGTAAAFPLARARLPFRRAFRVSFTIPIMIPALLIGISLLVF